MRRADPLLLVLLLAAVALPGCKRLTFIKPNPDHRGYTQVAPDYNLRPERGERGRVELARQLQAAERALQGGQLEHAEQAARAAARLDPRSADAQTLLGAVADAGGRTRQAGEHYARALQLAPAQGVALNNRAVWLCANGQAAQSLPLFRQALADPAYPTPLLAQANAGTCAVSAGQLNAAEADLRMVLAADPRQPVALESMAELSLRRGQPLEARAFIQRRLEAAPATRKSLELAARIESTLGDNVASRRYLEQLKQQFPQHPAAAGGGIQQ